MIATTRHGARAARRHVPEQLPVLAVEDCEPRRSGRAHDQHTAAGVQIRQIAARELSGPTHSLREPVPGGHDEGAGLLVDGHVTSVAVLDGLRCRPRCGRCLCQDLAGSVQSDVASPEDAVRVLGPSRNANGPAAVRQPVDAQRWQVGRPDLLTRSAVESDERSGRAARPCHQTPAPVTARTTTMRVTAHRRRRVVDSAAERGTRTTMRASRCARWLPPPRA